VSGSELNRVRHIHHDGACAIGSQAKNGLGDSVSAGMKTFTPVAAVLLITAPFSPALDEEQFKRLHAQLQPAEDEAWRGLPWRLSVLEARAAAAAEKMPVYMLVRSGHPLGCV
jgi:hypothetical protein